MTSNEPLAPGVYTAKLVSIEGRRAKYQTKEGYFIYRTFPDIPDLDIGQHYKVNVNVTESKPPEHRIAWGVLSPNGNVILSTIGKTPRETGDLALELMGFQWRGLTEKERTIAFADTNFQMVELQISIRRNPAND